MRHTPVKTRRRRWTQMDPTECHTQAAPFLFLYRADSSCVCIERGRELCAPLNFDRLSTGGATYLFSMFSLSPLGWSSRHRSLTACSIIYVNAAQGIFLAVSSGFLDLHLLEHLIYVRSSRKIYIFRKETKKLLVKI